MRYVPHSFTNDAETSVSLFKSQVRADRGCLKELQSLEIECTTQPTPCNWRGPLTKLEV